jgi:hypothetical protein
MRPAEPVAGARKEPEVTAMLGILVWYCVPIAAVMLSTLIISVLRRHPGNRHDMDSIAGYRRFREALGRSQSLRD